MDEPVVVVVLRGSRFVRLARPCRVDAEEALDADADVQVEVDERVLTIAAVWRSTRGMQRFRKVGGE